MKYFMNENTQMFQYFTELMGKFLKEVFSRCDVQHGFDGEDLAEYMYNHFLMENPVYGDDYYFFPIDDYFNKVVVPHKIEVFLAGYAMIPMIEEYSKVFRVDSNEFIKQLLVHDLSKFSINEIAYAFYNFKDKSKNPESNRIAFELAWNHHKHMNPHHPEHWLGFGRAGVLESEFDMPYKYVLEMVADWIGAGEIYGSSLDEWLPKNRGTFNFSLETSVRLDIILNAI